MNKLNIITNVGIGVRHIFSEVSVLHRTIGSFFRNLNSSMVVFIPKLTWMDDEIWEAILHGKLIQTQNPFFNRPKTSFANIYEYKVIFWEWNCIVYLACFKERTCMEASLSQIEMETVKTRSFANRNGNSKNERPRILSLSQRQLARFPSSKHKSNIEIHAPFIKIIMNYRGRQNVYDKMLFLSCWFGKVFYFSSLYCCHLTKNVQGNAL